MNLGESREIRRHRFCNCVARNRFMGGAPMVQVKPNPA
jgi:hypothetical protein